MAEETPPYTPPTRQSTGFNCPLCLAFSQQEWGNPPILAGGTNYGTAASFEIARCKRCTRMSVWIDGVMIYPHLMTAPLPNTDLSEDVRRDFEEARTISGLSPRGAAALLRLAIQKICRELGEPGIDINKDIGQLVKKGLPARVQQAMDTVRVVGNNAVHPGQLDLRDNEDVVRQLFGLVNLVADVMISQPKHVEALYNSIVPENLRTAIGKRDTLKG